MNLSLNRSNIFVNIMTIIIISTSTYFYKYVITLHLQVECPPTIAGWLKAADRRTTDDCWSVRAARAWSPGLTTLLKEDDWSERRGRTERKR